MFCVCTLRYVVPGVKMNVGVARDMGGDVMGEVW